MCKSADLAGMLDFARANWWGVEESLYKTRYTSRDCNARDEKNAQFSLPPWLVYIEVLHDTKAKIHT